MLLRLLALTSLLASGGIFGFYHAWSSSTLIGLDRIDPRIAIAAMQAMNASVRNWIFAPLFFGTPLILLVTAALASGQGLRRPAALFAVAGLISAFGSVFYTLQLNVPMNEALALVPVPQSQAEAEAIWQDYSPRWQVLNAIRMGMAGVALLICGLALMTLPQGNPMERNVILS